MPVKKKSGSAAKPLAKKVTAAKTKKPAAKKTTSSNKKEESLAQRIANAIIAGEFDGDLILLDDALTERSSKVAETRAAKKTSAKEKKVAPPPKKKGIDSISLTANQTYLVSPSLKSLSGAKVKFLRFKVGADKKQDKTKARVEMLVDKPGNPKGKQVVIPASALVHVEARAKK